jgi:hypothetical protein
MSRRTKLCAKKRIRISRSRFGGFLQLNWSILTAPTKGSRGDHNAARLKIAQARLSRWTAMDRNGGGGRETV